MLDTSGGAFENEVLGRIFGPKNDESDRRVKKNS
jgi:hypothetical protein